MLRVERCMPFFVLMAIFLTGCATKNVTVPDEKEFSVMAKRIAPVLRERSILDEKGAYITSLFGNHVPSQIGDLLFKRLSPAFRFQLDPSMLPATFARSRTANDSLELRPTGFVLGQGADTVTVSLLAVTDWNDDKVDDWLLLCRVNSPYNKTLRDYYLLVDKIDAPILKPRLIAVYDCMSRSCKLYIEVSGKKKLPITPEIPVIDVQAGQQDVTSPPERSAKTPESDSSGIKEQKLGG